MAAVVGVEQEQQRAFLRAAANYTTPAPDISSALVRSFTHPGIDK
jgi:hypothetical protein